MFIHHIHPQYHAMEERMERLDTLYRACLSQMQSRESGGSRPWRTVCPPHETR